MHIATQADIPFINEVLNHPKVRPHVWTGTEHIDSAFAIDIMWTLVVPGCGVMMAEAMGDGVYVAMVAFLPSAWGMEAVGAMREGIRRIFTDTDCNRLYGTVKPLNLRGSRSMIALGMKDVGLRGNRVVGYIDYLDLLDEEMFQKTVLGGWSGKALYWWGIKAGLEDSHPFIPIDPIKPVFAKDGVVYDFA